MTKKLSESSLLLTLEELQKHILGMTLFNDMLARAVLEDKEACEHILRVLTGIKTLVIKRTKHGIAHACLCCQVYYYFRLVFGKDFVDECFVSQVAFDEGPLGVAVLGSAGSNLLQTVFLDGYVVVVVHVVQTDDFHRGHGAQKLQNKVAADEAGGTGY